LCKKTEPLKRNNMSRGKIMKAEKPGPFNTFKNFNIKRTVTTM
jgi:hypothetical protein